MSSKPIPSEGLTVARTPGVLAYLLHKPSGLAVVRLSGRGEHLVKHNSPERIRAYQRATAAWPVGRRQNTVQSEELCRGPIAVAALVPAYENFAKSLFVRAGALAGGVGNIRNAVMALASPSVP